MALDNGSERLVLEVGRMMLMGSLLIGCGSSGGAQTTGADGAARADGPMGDDGEAVVVAEAGDAGGEGSESLHAEGGSWLDGSMAFAVHYSVFHPQDLSVSCVYVPGPSTGYGDVVVLLTDTDLSSTCTSGTFPASSAGHPFVRIEVESPSYAMDGGGLAPDGGPVAPLTPGSYAIGFGNQTAADVCRLASTSGTALVDVMSFATSSCCSTVRGTSVSGTVTLRDVTQGHVAGSFQVLLAPVDGGVDTQAATPFTGQFDTTSCPGNTQ